MDNTENAVNNCDEGIVNFVIQKSEDSDQQTQKATHVSWELCKQ